MTMGQVKKSLTYAIIPARSGSQTVKNKNIAMVHGFPMIAYSIAVAKVIPEISRVIVSTDSEEYAQIARKFGAEVPFIRPAEISGSNSTDIQFMKHAIQWFEENEGILPEFWVHLRPTAPLREPEKVKEAICKMQQDPSADSLRSGHKTTLCPFKWFWQSEDGYFQTINGITLDEANGPRQSFPQIYIPDGYVDVLRTQCIVEKNVMHGDKMIAYTSPETIDVDQVNDLEELRNNPMKLNDAVYQYLVKCERGE